MKWEDSRAPLAFGLTDELAMTRAGVCPAFGHTSRATQMTRERTSIRVQLETALAATGYHQANIKNRADLRIGSALVGIDTRGTWLREAVAARPAKGHRKCDAPDDSQRTNPTSESPTAAAQLARP
jgi:hypothetical protein